MADIIVFTLETCPRCEQVKNAMLDAGLEFEEMRMDSAEGVTELRINQCFATEAPVVYFQGAMLETKDLFVKDQVVRFWEDGL